MMNRLFTIILILMTNAIVFSQTNENSQAEALAKKLLKEENLPGLSISIARGDSIVWSKGFGYADVNEKKLVTPDKRFRIGSLTKLFTAATADRLSQDGLLDLDSPVRKYVPSFPDKGTTITTRQLLGHLSGIRQYGRDEYINTHHYASVKEALTIFENDSLLFVPGTRYHYSSYGYVLVSAVIEGASKEKFLHFLKDSLFDVLDLTSVSPDYNDTTDTTQAKPYSSGSKNGWKMGPFNDNSNRWGAGGFLATSADMARFGSSLLTNNFLNDSTRKVMFTSQKTTDGHKTGVGLGWRVAIDSVGNIYYHHGGDSIGGRAFLLIYPSTNVVVAILANLTFAQFGEKEALEFARLFSR
jgi:serine beta-lactamase-like protein LACTB, mitochondrial